MLRAGERTICRLALVSASGSLLQRRPAGNVAAAADATAAAAASVPPPAAAPTMAQRRFASSAAQATAAGTSAEAAVALARLLPVPAQPADIRRATQLLMHDTYDGDFVGGAEENDRTVQEREAQFLTSVAAEGVPDDFVAAEALHLAGVYIKNYLLDKADALLSVLTEYCEAAGGPFHWKHLQNVATLRFKQNRQVECAARFEELIKIAPPSPATHANLTTAYNSVGAYDKALEHIEKGVALKGGVMDKDDMWSMGLVKKNTGHPQEAVGFMEKALALHQAEEPRDGVMLAKVHDSLAAVYEAAGDLAKAEEQYKAAHGIFTQAVGGATPLTGRTAGSLGSVLLARGRPGEAFPYCLEALDAEVHKDAVHPTPFYELLAKLGEACRADDFPGEAGSLEDAAPLVRVGVASLEARGMLADGNGGVLLQKVGEVLYLANPRANAAEAVALLTRARALLVSETTVDLSDLIAVADSLLLMAKESAAEAEAEAEAKEKSADAGKPKTPPFVSTPSPVKPSPAAEAAADAAAEAEAEAELPEVVVQVDEPFHAQLPEPTRLDATLLENLKLREDNKALVAENASLRAENARLAGLMKRVKDGFAALSEV
eukprot:Rhum_TRINITY_DN14737_c12_g2::Rhum_TRINITY_DN14737_c12_g2_i1::g.113667::m.113667